MQYRVRLGVSDMAIARELKIPAGLSDYCCKAWLILQMAVMIGVELSII